MLVFGNLLFLAGMSFLAYELFCWEKSGGALQGLLWLAVSIWSAFCVHALVAAAYNAAAIPIGTLSIGGADLALAALLHRRRNGKKQQYLWHKLDIFLLAALFLMTAAIGLARYGAHMDMVYRSADGITHYYEAFHAFESGTIKAMYFAALNNSFFVSLFAPFVKVTRLYHVAPIADLWWFYLSALTVFGFVRDRCKSLFSICAGSVLGVLYMLGYPLSNLLMGFMYLGIGVSLSGVILILLELYMKEEESAASVIVLLMLCCLGLITSYALFVPPLFLAAGISCLIKNARRGSLRWKFFAEGIGIFLIPCVIGLAYTWAGIFTGGVTFSSAIALEGDIYRNNYSDYLPILPLAISGVWMGAKRRSAKLFCTRLLFALEVLYAAFILCLSVLGYASAYYFYKNNYLIWMILYVFAIYAVSKVRERQAQKLILAAGCVWLIPLAVSVLGLEEVLWEKNASLQTEFHSGGAYCAIYRDNCIELRKLRSNPTLYVAVPEKVELYEIGYELYKETGALVFPVASGANCYFENAITNQWNPAYLHIDKRKYRSVLEKYNPEYICVLKDFSWYKNHQDYFLQYPKIFENSAGFIAVYNGEK